MVNDNDNNNNIHTLNYNSNEKQDQTTTLLKSQGPNTTNPETVKATDNNKTNITIINVQELAKKNTSFNRPRSNSLNDASYTIKLYNGNELNKNKNVGSDNNQQSTSNDGWQNVSKRKRSRNSPGQTSTRFKQTKVDDYWLSAPMDTANRFEALRDPEPEPEIQEKPVKPPPICVNRVNNIQPLINLLNDVIRDDYEIKVLKDEMVKIQPKTIESYKTVMKELKLKNTEFYTT